MPINRQAAKAAGYSDMDIDAYEKKQQPQQQGFSLTDLLPIAGGVIGGTAGSLLGPVGTIGGGAAGSAGGEWLRQALNHQVDTTKDINYGDVAKEGAWGLAGGVGGELLGKGVGLLAKGASKGLTKAGTEAIASQFSVPRSAARALDMPGTIQKLSRYGINNIDNIEPIAERVTGANGVITKLTRQAAASASDVNTDGIMQLTQELAQNPAIAAGQDQKLVNFIQKGLSSVQGGAKGSIAPGSNPSEVFGLIQQLEKQASAINRVPKFQRTAQDNAIQDAYKQISDELKDRLFQGAGGDAAVQKLVSNPELIQEMASIHPELAKDFANAKTVGELRSIAAPFVKGSQLAQETEFGSQTGFGGAGGAVKGVGKLIQNPLNLAAVPLSTNAVNSEVGGALLRLGKGESIPGASLIKSAVGQGAAQGADAMMHMPRADASAGSTIPMSTDATSLMGGNNQNAGAKQPQPMLTAQEAQILMAKFPKQASEIKAIYDVGKPDKETQFKPTERQQQFSSAGQGAAYALQLLESGKVKSGPISGRIAQVGALTGGISPEQQDYQSTIALSRSALLNAYLGGAIPPQEFKRISDSIPDVNDPTGVASQKLKTFIREMARFSVPTQGTGATGIPAPQY